MPKSLPNTIVASLAVDATLDDDIRLTPITQDNLQKLIAEAMLFADQLDNGDVACDRPQAMASYIFGVLSDRAQRIHTPGEGE